MTSRDTDRCDASTQSPQWARARARTQLELTRWSAAKIVDYLHLEAIVAHPDMLTLQLTANSACHRAGGGGGFLFPQKDSPSVPCGGESHSFNELPVDVEGKHRKTAAVVATSAFGDV